jgi:cell division protein FtsW
MQKNVVPHPYSDFIFAILVEEYGMIGGLVIVGLYMTLLWRGMQAVRRSKDAFAGLLSAGLTVSLVLQAMAHFAVVLDLGPVTGQPLPLVSMGGTSLLFTGLSLGIIQSVSRDGLEEDFEPEPSLA